MKDSGQDNDQRPVASAELRDALELVVLSEERNLSLRTVRRAKDFRFGVGMILVGLFAAIVGAYPLALGEFMRIAFLVFALICVGVGAVYVDKSNRNRRLRNPRSNEGDGKGRHPPRLVR